MLPILIKSFVKYLSVIGCYHPIGQAIPLVINPVSKVKLMHIIFKARHLFIAFIFITREYNAAIVVIIVFVQV